jgi:elongation factor Ts
MAVTIDSKMVAKLREKTGAGMMDCKKALTEAAGDFDKAIEMLRTKGMATAEKKAGRATKDGSIALSVAADGKSAVLFELNCETDFVACTDQFQTLLKSFLEMAVTQKFTSKDQFPKEQITEFIAKLGENTSVGNYYRYETTGNGLIGQYMHPTPKPGIFKLGVIVEIDAEKEIAPDNETIKTLIRDIAMQVASQRPEYVSRKCVPEEVITKEKEIYMEQSRQEGKPEQMLEKIALGKLNKFYSMVCLIDQPFIKDDKLTVAQLVDKVSKELDNTIKVKRFARIKVGESL